MWKTYALCPCGVHYFAPFGDKFHIHEKACGNCGEDKSKWNMVVAKYVSESKWYKPSTWFTGRWEYKNKTPYPIYRADCSTIMPPLPPKFRIMQEGFTFKEIDYEKQEIVVCENCSKENIFTY